MLTSPEGEALIDRYGEVYETTLRRLSSGGAPVGPAPDTDREGPAFLSKDAQPWRDEAAAVAVSGTGAAPTLRSPPSSRPPRPSPAPPPLPSDVHPLAGTAAVNPGALRPALPFAERGDVVPPPAPLPRPSPASPLAETLDLGVRAPLPATPFEPKPGDPSCR